jgi:hypothetical protein
MVILDFGLRRELSRTMGDFGVGWLSWVDRWVRPLLRGRATAMLPGQPGLPR